MLGIEVILGFCEKTNFFTSKPTKNCIIEATKLDLNFGKFIKDIMINGTKFSSAEAFIKAYKQFCVGGIVYHS